MEPDELGHVALVINTQNTMEHQALGNTGEMTRPQRARYICVKSGLRRTRGLGEEPRSVLGSVRSPDSFHLIHAENPSNPSQGFQLAGSLLVIVFNLLDDRVLTPISDGEEDCISEL